LSITINVNGKDHEISADPDTALLYVLRNELNLYASKFGCGLAQCGVCSVLLDGQEIRACITSVSQAVGHAVTTLEGLPALWAAKAKSPSTSELHPIQQAWIDEQVPQCGYCQSGMMIQAASLLHENPNPTNKEIRTAMDGHICRCGTQMRIMKAVERAADVMRKES